MLEESNKRFVAVLLTRVKNFSGTSVPRRTVDFPVPKMHSLLVWGSLTMEVGGGGYEVAAAAVGTQIICHLCEVSVGSLRATPGKKCQLTIVPHQLAG